MLVWGISFNVKSLRIPKHHLGSRNEMLVDKEKWVDFVRCILSGWDLRNTFKLSTQVPSPDVCRKCRISHSVKQAAKMQGEGTLPKKNKLYPETWWLAAHFQGGAVSSRDDFPRCPFLGIWIFSNYIPYHSISPSTGFEPLKLTNWKMSIVAWISPKHHFLGIHSSIHKPEANKHLVRRYFGPQKPFPKDLLNRYLEEFKTQNWSPTKKMGGLWRYSCEKKSTSVVNDFRTNQIIYVYLSESQQPFDSLKPRSGWAQAPSRQLADLELKFYHLTSPDVFVKWFDGSWCVF